MVKRTEDIVTINEQ
jgi:ElaB/YqjD/DUF883 family membrane-anchored ribosome-binding protein